MGIPTTVSRSMWVRPIRATLALLLIVPLFSGCSLLFVHGPPSGWQDAQDLEIIALTQPCTSTSKVLPIIDGLIGVTGLLLGTVYWAATDNDLDEELRNLGIALLLGSGGFGYSTYKGNKNINDCRAFNARLIELRGGDAVGQASYEWLDEFSPAPDFGADPPDLPVAIPSLRWFNQLFPAPDFGANAFDPVFRGAISNSPDQ